MRPFFPQKQKPGRQRGQSRGQSMVEFVLVMPIFVLVLMAGGSMAIGTYEAHMAADAARQPLLHKLELANNPGAISGGILAGYMNGGGETGTVKSGSLIDSASIKNIDAYNSLVVGLKTYTPPVSMIPSFTIKIGQVINRNLLQPASTGGAETRPYGVAWVPPGPLGANVPTTPP